MHQDSGPTPWWRHSVVYQVYIRSFADSNGDGTGDVNGLRSRLPYLQDLGVDAVWVNPWYASPLADGGYDVADYRRIEPRYGSLDDAEALIAEARELGIRIITDLVPNHTSDQHRWFQEATAAPQGDASRRRYHILPGRGPDGSQPPTDWTSVFGGSAWTRLDDGEWYLHLFDPSQPDLNWENPEVRDEFHEVLRFWLDRGAAGFRVDVAHGLVKDPTWPDMNSETDDLLEGAKTIDHPFWDRDGIHDIVRGWRSVLDEYSHDAGDQRMMVAEAWVATQERLARYLRPDEYHQAFNFGFLESEWNATSFRQAIETAISTATAVGSTPTWVLSNHDVVRHTTRYGLPPGTDWRRWLLDGPHDVLDAELGLRRARAAALLMLGLPGGTYLYQGEELGLPEVWDLPTDVLDDPVWERSGHRRKGRDGCRVPVPWSIDGPSAGFGSGSSWLPQPDDWGQKFSAEVQSGVSSSTLSLYVEALRLRRADLVQDEVLEWVAAPDDVLAYQRGSGVECWVNVSAGPIPLPDGQVLLRSDADTGPTLDPDTAVWIRR